jgi:preprotein translocase subunit YajC
VVDVAVVEGAVRRGDAVVTSGAGHVRKIAAAASVTIWIEPV